MTVQRSAGRSEVLWTMRPILRVLALVAACGSVAPLGGCTEVEDGASESVASGSLSHSSGWTRVDERFAGSTGLEGVAVVDGRIVAVGSGPVGFGSGSPESSDETIVWTSTDGSHWTPADTALPSGTTLNDVVAGGPGAVAVGTGEPPLWTSADGLSWIPVDDPAGALENARLSDVTTGGPGLVAVGAVGALPAAWTSPDGLHWSKVPPPASVTYFDSWSGVTEGGPGLVAVGASSTTGEPAEDAPGLGAPSAAVWVSADGSSWSRVPHDPAAFSDFPRDVQMNAVVAGGPGLVAVGHQDAIAADDGFGKAAVWTSTDGLSWERVPDERGLVGGSEAWDVVATSTGLVAAGMADGDAAVWTSADGLTWAAVERDALKGPHEEGIYGVTEGGPGMVAVGWDWSEAHESAAAWTTEE